MDKIRMAVKAILHDHRDKVEFLAKKLGEGVHPSTLYGWGESGTEDNKRSNIPIARAVQLTLVTGDTRLIAAIAEDAGGIFVPGKALVEGRFENEKSALRVLKAATALIESYTTAIMDGKITLEEYRDLAREAMQLHLAAACIAERAREVAGL